MLYKVVKDYITKERTLYNKLLERRKSRFIELVELEAPKFMIIREVCLLNESFLLYLLSRFRVKLRNKLKRPILL